MAPVEINLVLQTPAYLHSWKCEGLIGGSLGRLINDDYFLAIRLLCNEGLIVSAAKLLMSFIDSIAFIEFGDIPDNFIKWLEAYAHLDALGITSRELWEFRNGILYMTNINSRAVSKGSVRSLILSIGDLDRAPALDNPSWKRLNLKQLLGAVADGVSEWAQTYNQDQNKFLEFVARYDLTVSDTRAHLINA